MTVQGEEFEAVVGAVLEDNDGAVIERSVVVREGVNGGVERGGNGRPGGDEQINAKVDGAALAGRIRAASKEGRAVNSPWLVVTADSDGRVGRARGCLNFGSHARLSGIGGIGAKKSAAHAQIQDEPVPFPKICRDDRGRRARIPGEPTLDFFGVGNGGKTAGRAEYVVSQARMDFGETFQSRPCRGFADGDIRIVRDKRLAMR